MAKKLNKRVFTGNISRWFSGWRSLFRTLARLQRIHFGTRSSELCGV